MRLRSCYYLLKNPPKNRGCYSEVIPYTIRTKSGLLFYLVWGFPEQIVGWGPAVALSCAFRIPSRRCSMGLLLTRALTCWIFFVKKRQQQTADYKVDSGNEFTQRRLVEMESSIGSKVDSVGNAMREAQAANTEKVIHSTRDDLATLATQGNAMLDAAEKSAAEQEQRMSDVRRQNLMILDLLTNAQQTMQGSAESLESFTRSEIMRDSAANIEMQIRDVIMQQMGKLQAAFLGDDDEGGSGSSFKAAVTSMVMRLEDAHVQRDVHGPPTFSTLTPPPPLPQTLRPKP